MRTRLLLLLILVSAAGLAPLAQSKQTLLMNRLGPSQMTLYIANGDGSGERPLLASSGFDYNASFSPDGHWIVFTSERAGSGQADIYRVRPDGSGLERLTDDPALDDQGALSPDGHSLARRRDGPFRTDAGVLSLIGAVGLVRFRTVSTGAVSRQRIDPRSR